MFLGYWRAFLGWCYVCDCRVLHLLFLGFAFWAVYSGCFVGGCIGLFCWLWFVGFGFLCVVSLCGWFVSCFGFGVRLWFGVVDWCFGVWCCDDG